MRGNGGWRRRIYARKQPRAVLPIGREIPVVIRQGANQRLSPRIGVEALIVIAKLGQELRVVNKRISAKQHIVVEVIEAIFPMMRDDSIGMMRQKVGGNESWLHGCNLVFHALQSACEAAEMSVLHELYGVRDIDCFE